MPLIAIAAPLSCQTAEVGADNRRAGFLVGSELGRTASLRPSCTKNSLVIVTNSATSTASEERAHGIRSGIETECPGLLPTELVLDVGPADRAHEEFAAALNALPDDTDILLGAVDDGVALSAVAAIPETRAPRTTIAAIGADQRARCEIVANPQWIGDAALFPTATATSRFLRCSTHFRVGRFHRKCMSRRRSSPRTRWASYTTSAIVPTSDHIPQS